MTDEAERTRRRGIEEADATRQLELGRRWRIRQGRQAVPDQFAPSRRGPETPVDIVARAMAELSKE